MPARFARAMMISALVLATASLDAQPPPSSQEPDLFVHARQWLARGDTAAARGALERLTETQPEFAPGWGWLGLILTETASTELMEFRQRQQAERALRRALQLDPENPLYIYELGVLTRKQLGSANDAERLIDRALRLADEHPDRVAPVSAAELNLLRRLARRKLMIELQAEFERLRRDLLPRRREDPRCGEQVGRVCLTWELARRPEGGEPDTLRAARDTLLARLEEAAASLPEADEWIMTQRVRYLLEAGRSDEALTLVTTCGLRAEWWCTAMAGHIRQSRGEFGAADSAFSAALDRMPVEVRAFMSDVSALLDDETARGYVWRTNAERDSLERRLWWLADPLYLTPHNDRRLEHLARRVMVRMQADAGSGFGVSWGPDVTEVVTRHGWPLGWVKIPRRRRDQIIAYYEERARRFVPPTRWLEAPLAIPASVWSFDLRDPFSTYAPLYVTSFQSLEHQLAIFQRRDSVELLAVYDQSADPAWTDADAEVGLFLMTDERSTARVIRRPTVGPRGSFRLRVPATPTLMSLELFSEADSLAARARYGLPLRRVPPGVLAVSSLLVTEAASPTPETLDRAASLARGSLRVQPGERLALYWEVYGIDEAQPITQTLVAYKLDERGQPVGGSDDAPLSLSWRDIAPERVYAWARSLRVDLPRDLSPGRYVFLLQVTARRREPVRQARVFLVEK